MSASLPRSRKLLFYQLLCVALTTFHTYTHRQHHLKLGDYLFHLPWSLMYQDFLSALLSVHICPQSFAKPPHAIPGPFIP